MPERPARGPKKAEMPQARGAQEPAEPAPISGGTELKPTRRVPESGELFSPAGGTPLHDTSSLFSSPEGWEAFQAAHRR